MNKVFLTLVILLSISAINSQFTDCVSGQWDWQTPAQSVQYVAATNEWIVNWNWNQNPNATAQATHVQWCAVNCVGNLHPACTFDPAPVSGVTPLDKRCFCSGNEDNGGLVQSEFGVCDAGFTFVDVACVENCLINPAQHCATCVQENDHSLCASCVAGFFLKNGACVSDCGDGFYGSKLDWTCYACDYHWVGRRATPDAFCYSNCFVPTTTSGLAPTCQNSNGFSQTCKCLCPPDNTPNYVVGGTASVEQACKVNTYQDVVNGQVPSQPNLVSHWWLAYTIKPLYAAWGNIWCYDNCPGANCLLFCDPI